MVLHLSSGCLKSLERVNDLSRVTWPVRRQRLDLGILNLATGLLHGIFGTGGAWNFSTLPPEEHHLQGYGRASNAIFSFQLIFGKTVKLPPISNSTGEHRESLHGAEKRFCRPGPNLTGFH